MRCLISSWLENLGSIFRISICFIRRFLGYISWRRLKMQEKSGGEQLEILKRLCFRLRLTRKGEGYSPSLFAEEGRQALNLLRKFMICWMRILFITYVSPNNSYIWANSQAKFLTAQYPKILRNEVSVHLIQSRSHILNTYDEALSRYAEERFARDNVEVYTNSRVEEVTSDLIVFTQKSDDGTIVTKEIPYGLCLWSTGVCEYSHPCGSSRNLQNSNEIIKSTNRIRQKGSRPVR